MSEEKNEKVTAPVNAPNPAPNVGNPRMKTCESCGKEYAKSAKACPYCGAVNKKPSRNDVKLEKFKSMTAEQMVKRENKIIRIFSIVCAVLLLLTIVGFSTNSSNNVSSTSADYSSLTEQADDDTSDSFLKGATVSQKNAYQSALDYLDYDSFSKKGLIEQLKYEKYSEADSEWAVDHLDVDWNEQAAEKAKDYLDMESFSHDGLVDQLVYEGFTKDQAEYGASKAGL